MALTRCPAPSHPVGNPGGFVSQLPYKYHQNRVASVGDLLMVCPWVASRAAFLANSDNSSPSPDPYSRPPPSELARLRAHRKLGSLSGHVSWTLTSAPALPLRSRARGAINTISTARLDAVLHALILRARPWQDTCDFSGTQQSPTRNRPWWHQCAEAGSS